jgi:hypothetical protein
MNPNLILEQREYADGCLGSPNDRHWNNVEFPREGGQLPAQPDQEMFAHKMRDLTGKRDVCNESYISVPDRLLSKYLGKTVNPKDTQCFIPTSQCRFWYRR